MANIDDLRDPELDQVLSYITHARSSKSAALVCKRWLAVSKQIWNREISACVPAEGLAWTPALAREIDSFQNVQNQYSGSEVEEHRKRVHALPFVMGFGPAPSAGMWCRTKPTLRGCEQVFLDSSGAEQSGVWGCNESIGDRYSCDTNWNRGFVWGVMAFSADDAKETAYYAVEGRDDDLDFDAIVSQYPLCLPHELTCIGFLGGKLASHSGRLYCIGGRLLRMSYGNTEESVMTSLGFKRNPSVAPNDYGNEARWCRLPTVVRTDLMSLEHPSIVNVRSLEHVMRAVVENGDALDNAPESGAVQDVLGTFLPNDTLAHVLGAVSDAASQSPPMRQIMAGGLIWRLQDTFEDTEIARKTVIEMIVHAAHASQSGSAASEDDLMWLLCRGICLSVYARCNLRCRRAWSTWRMTFT